MLVWGEAHLIVSGENWPHLEGGVLAMPESPQQD